jgi:outer membrane autotransporter protein
MRTPHIQTEKRQTRFQAETKLRGFLATALAVVLVFVAMAAPVLAVDAVWLFSPGSGDWNTNTNWNPPTAPVNIGDTATFDLSLRTSLSLSNDVTIDSITFNAGASAFTINTGSGTTSLTLVGVGIVNNSGTTQTITNDFGSSTDFLNNSSAANVTIINSASDGAGSTNFMNGSTAANAIITNDGGDTNFLDNSTAANATITNLNLGTTIFANGASAGNATITNQGDGSSTKFFDTASGGNARLINANATAFFDISGLTTSGTTAGSIEGNGTFFLGSKNLTVGSNGLSTTFSGVISDMGNPTSENTETGGSLTKVGAGTLTLTGANTYTGPTVVGGGSLIVDGSIGTGQTSVNAAGLLGGTGTIRGSVLNSGIVSPGNSAGALTINNNYTQSAGGTLRIEIAGVGASDLLRIGGTANLGGTVQFLRLNNFQLHVGDQITFLTAKGGVNGTFATVQDDFSTSGTIVGTEIIYLSNSVVLEGTQGSFEEVGRTICQTPNDTAVGAALDSAVGDSRAAPLIEFLNSQSLTEICRDLDLIAPEELTSMFNVGVSMANIQTDNLERRMNNVRAGSTGFSAEGFSINTRGPDLNLGLAGPSGPEGKSGPSVMQPTPQNRWGVFVTGIGEFTNVDSTANAAGFDLSTGGVTFGVDYRLSPNFAIGMMGGYAHTNGDLVNGGSLDVDGGKFGLYATAFSGGFYVNAAATGGLNDYDTHRTALLGTASGDTEGHEFTGLISAGYDWKTGNLTVGPIASYQYTYVDFDGFTEHGSLAPLTFGDQSADSSRTALGAKASYDLQMGHVLVRPEIRAAWQHEFGDRDYSIVSRFANGAGNSFTVTGPAIGRDSLLLGAGVAVLFNDRVSAYAYYDGELARTNYSSNNVSGGVRITF